MRWIAIGLALAMVGCGKVAPDESDASATLDAAPVIDAGPDVDPLAAPLGTIIVGELQHPGSQLYQPTYVPFIEAQFSATSVDTTNANCVSTKPTTQCGFPPTCLFAPPLASAGTLTLAGGLFGGGVDVTEGDAAILPYQFGGKQTTKSFNAGEVLMATASGGQVPAFTAQVTVPANIKLITPTSPYVIPSGQDLTFTWSGGESDAYVSMAFEVKVPITANCTFDAAAGTGTIPHAALGGVTGSANVDVMVIRDAKSWAGDYPIDFQIQRTIHLALTIE